MNAAVRRFLVASVVALSLASGLAACDHAPPVVDGCHAICVCRTFLDRERAECESDCQSAAADPNNTGLDDCLTCADDAPSCSAFETSCANACFSSTFPN